MSIFGRFASYFNRDSFYRHLREFARTLAYCNTPPAPRQVKAGTHRPVKSDGHMKEVKPRRIEGIRGSLHDTRVNKRKKSLARLRA